MASTVLGPSCSVGSESPARSRPESSPDPLRPPAVGGRGAVCEGGCPAVIPMGLPPAAALFGEGRATRARLALRPEPRLAPRRVTSLAGGSSAIPKGMTMLCTLPPMLVAPPRCPESPASAILGTCPTEFPFGRALSWMRGVFGEGEAIGCDSEAMKTPSPQPGHPGLKMRFFSRPLPPPSARPPLTFLSLFPVSRYSHRD
mmetsp:Transcript_34566/g.83491  ORF Transcript_34566/g.83491 Transcript_34566/m.83491 type:complete len:201 (-) Transcript_34566:9-611(-)